MTTPTGSTVARRLLLEDRWRVIVSRPIEFRNEPGEVTNDNARVYYRTTKAIRMLAARMVDEIHGDDEAGALEALQEEVWSEIRDRLIAFAELIDELREARRAVAS